jgi:holliday junction DNA helicase RuvA
MISYITGKILKTSISKDSYVDILTDSGIAYRISVPSTYVLPSKGEKFSLYTHFHVREDSQTLFGFKNEEERDFFEQLISVSGIGPKIGIGHNNNIWKRGVGKNHTGRRFQILK